MLFETVLVEDSESHVAITLNRPEALNSISREMIVELTVILDMYEGRENVRVLSITGAGRAFSAGVDLKSAQERITASGGADANFRFLDDFRKLLLRIENFPRPVIAAVNGLALAGGLELVLACDLVLAARSAKFGDAHANYGLVPGGGSSVRLPRKIGVTRAKQMIFSGDFLEAEILREWGLVNWVVEDEDLPTALVERIDELAAKSPLGLSRMKQMVNDGLEQPIDTALKAELLINAQHSTSKDRLEGLAAFKEKRKPKFTGR
ncbi:enoyl-CoA hydratase/isomerase family protein [Sneathiella limimaris]|uniref:enoyl-CoA hydratase/isomerase family protein n=1 Tax=Sneathiella limimaris TaxID=1964213 RepID=UPI00146CFDCB|nr:enoyl-CoA hydratase/isomerase family protein [Sneathiella limimaris]